MCVRVCLLKSFCTRFFFMLFCASVCAHLISVVLITSSVVNLQTVAACKLSAAGRPAGKLPSVECGLILAAADKRVNDGGGGGSIRPSDKQQDALPPCRVASSLSCFGSKPLKFKGPSLKKKAQQILLL